MLILSAEFRTRLFFEFLVTKALVVFLFRRERGATEIVASGSQSYKGYKYGNYSFGRIFLIKFSVGCVSVCVNSSTQIVICSMFKDLKAYLFSNL